VARSFEMSGIHNSDTQHNDPEDPNPQHYPIYA